MFVVHRSEPELPLWTDQLLTLHFRVPVTLYWMQILLERKTVGLPRHWERRQNRGEFRDRASLRRREFSPGATSDRVMHSPSGR